VFRAGEEGCMAINATRVRPFVAGEKRLQAGIVCYIRKWLNNL